MLDHPPQNKSLHPQRPNPGANGGTGSSTVTADAAKPPEKPSDEAIRKAKDEFDAVTKAVAIDPAAPKVIGYGTCQRCGVMGDMMVSGTQHDRHTYIKGCKCNKAPSC